MNINPYEGSAAEDFMPDRETEMNNIIRRQRAKLALVSNAVTLEVAPSFDVDLKDFDNYSSLASAKTAIRNTLANEYPRSEFFIKNIDNLTLRIWKLS